MEERISFIKHYKNSIEKSQDNPERVLHCLKKLQNVRINVQDLQETGIGKTVNSLRKLDGEAGELATKLVTKWKDQISKMNEDEPKPEEVVVQPAENTDSNKKPSKSHSSSSSNHHHSSSSTNHKEHKEKDKKSSSSDSKHHSHKSHHTSSSSSHKTSNSHKRNRDDAGSKENETNAKKLKGDQEKSDSKKSHKSESSTNGTSSKSKNKEHKSASPLKRKRSHEDESKEFDGSEGIGFAEALAAFDMPCSSSKVRKHDMADKITSVKSSSGSTSKSSSSHKKDKQHEEKKKEKEKASSSSSRPSTSSADVEFKKPPVPNFTQTPKLLTQKPNLDILPDIVNELPNDVSIPEYRPLPMNSAMKEYILGSNSQSRHSRVLTEGELLVQSFSSKANRTRVFSGNSKTRSDVPKLFDMCIRILQENIDYLECTGGVPFEILKPVLERAKAEQLTVIEYYNPYLLEDSDVLWKPHCQRKWKNKQPREMETWREMYERCTREDDEKLNRLTQNIQKKQVITSNGIQKTKMAFVDSMVKAPRGMVRKQEQFGTNRKLVVSPAARVEALKNIQPNLAAPGDVRLRVAAGLRDDAQQVVGRNTQRISLTKKAPMMAKILSKFKR